MPRLQEPLQDFHGGDSGLEHQTSYRLHQLLQGSPPQETPSSYAPAAPPTSQAFVSDPISQVAACHSSKTRQRRRHDRAPTTHGTVGRRPSVRLDHHVFTKGEWKQARLREHPRVPITISIDTSAQTRYGNPTRTSNTHAEVSAIADTGAQSDLWSVKDFLACGFSHDDLLPIHLSLSAANHSPISIEGAFFAKITTRLHNREATSCRSMIYVSNSVQALYLSYDSLLTLGILSNYFPLPQTVETPTGKCHTSDPESVNTTCELPPINTVRAINNGCNTSGDHRDITYSCPQRDATPPRPSELPFPCTAENNGQMKKWLLDRYASFTFNTCPHRALPNMEGPPIEIHVDPTATPKACHTPASVPLYWQQRVYEDLLRDEALGVIERVPYGEPVTWCHQMVITRKHDDSSRRTVDLSPLNKFCKCETFATETPFHLARRIPEDIKDSHRYLERLPQRTSAPI